LPAGSTKRGGVVTVALDNAHRPESDDLLGVIQACPGIRFVPLARPDGEIGAIEAKLGIERQDLRGWSPDIVASAAHEEGCRADPADCQLLIDLTGGLPLFVLNALSVAISDYDGSVKQFVADLARATHSKEVVQEIILGRVFDRLPDVVAAVADRLSFCDAPITRDEASRYVAQAGGPDPKTFALSLRHLLSKGLLYTKVCSRTGAPLSSPCSCASRARSVELMFLSKWAPRNCFMNSECGRKLPAILKLPLPTQKFRQISG
jgi:hypothetical protein